MPLPLITRENVQSLKAVQVRKNQNGEWDTFECRPVWIVVFRNRQKLVIKAENASHSGVAKSVKFGAKVMHNIDGETKAAPLEPNELDALCNLAPMRYCSRGQAGDLSVDYLRFYKTNPGATWLKMKFVDDLMDLKGIFKDEGKARGLLADMRMYPEIIETLGEVVAGDIFIGNEDRFSHGGKGKIGRVVNDGNILFKKVGQGQIKGIGLDWFEAQGDDVNLNTAPKADWKGMLLGNEVELEMFAKNAIDDINELFFNKMPDLTADELLTMHSVENFKDGLVSGREKLKKYFADRYKAGKKVPSGITARMTRLGWPLG